MQEMNRYIASEFNSKLVIYLLFLLALPSFNSESANMPGAASASSVDLGYRRDGVARMCKSRNENQSEMSGSGTICFPQA